MSLPFELRFFFFQFLAVIVVGNIYLYIDSRIHCAVSNVVFLIDDHIYIYAGNHVLEAQYCSVGEGMMYVTFPLFSDRLFPNDKSMTHKLQWRLAPPWLIEIQVRD